MSSSSSSSSSATTPVFSLTRMARIAALQGGASAGASAGVSASPLVLDVGGARALEAAVRALVGEAAAAAWLCARARGSPRLARGDVSVALAAQPARFGFAVELLPCEDLLDVALAPPELRPVGAAAASAAE